MFSSSSNKGRSGPSKYSQVPLNENYSDDSSDEGDDFIQRQIKSQQELMKKQDQGLEMLSKSAVRLGELSLTIHEELGEQNKMLNEMEDDLDKASDRMDYVTQKTRELIKKSGGKKNFLIIVGLIIVVVILVFLILYT